MSLPSLTYLSDILHLSNPLSVDRGRAHWSHCQIWLCWALFPRVVLQEGRLPAAVSASIRRLVGGTAQRDRWPGATPVYRGPRYVSVFIWMNCKTMQIYLLNIKLIRVWMAAEWWYIEFMPILEMKNLSRSKRNPPTIPSETLKWTYYFLFCSGGISKE